MRSCDFRSEAVYHETGVSWHVLSFGQHYLPVSAAAALPSYHENESFWKTPSIKSQIPHDCHGVLDLVATLPSFMFLPLDLFIKKKLWFPSFSVRKCLHVLYSRTALLECS